jgi:hypothetical protein
MVSDRIIPDVGAGGGAVALRDFGHLISLVTHDLR